MTKSPNKTEMNAGEMPARVRCKCGKFGRSARCPYAYEINDDETPCDCCNKCREEHAGDI